MKRSITIILLLLFIASLAVFAAFGSDIRTMLSPEAEWTFPDYEFTEERAYQKIPRSAVHFDSEGAAYVFVVRQNDKYSERSFKSVREDIEIMYDDDEYIYVREAEFPQSEQIITGVSASLSDGMMIILK